MKHVMILGRESDIGEAELAALYGDDGVKRPLEGVAIVSSNDIDFARIGSTKKMGILLAEAENKESSVIAAIKQFVANESRKVHPKRKKINFGVSIYGKVVTPLNQIEKTVDEALSKKNFNTRRVPNDSGRLSTAQVFHNKLDLSGFEFMLIGTGDKVFIAYTTEVQNITSYRKRDQARPGRDPKVGMLPPKLAQTMVNLAAADLQKSSEYLVLDPFCGTGVILQEALLMGFRAHGSDIEPRLVDMCRKNMQWLQKRFNRIESLWSVERADAQNHKWELDPSLVVSELDLGPPLSREPSDEKLQGLKEEATVLVTNTLTNLHDTLKPGVRLCLALPVWLQGERQITLPAVDDLRSLGYNRIRFKGINNELIYRRKDQIVGRHLLVLERI